MPELPEVEIVRRGLEPALVGRRISRVAVRRPDLRFPLPDGFAARIEGRRVEALSRRAKFLMASLSSGDVLVMHLGMTGRFTISKPGAGAKQIGDFVYETGVEAKHDHVVFKTEDGVTVTYNDPRRFGFMLLIPGAELDSHPFFRGLGAEPLGNGFNAPYLAARASRRTAPLKAFLMDQRNVAGLGNIYACEALHRAGLSPVRRAASLAKANGAPAARAERLAEAVPFVLKASLAAGGSTLRDYRQADGGEGAFQKTFFVYGREGQPCLKPGCSGTVRRIVQSGRSTFFCPVCQR